MYAPEYAPEDKDPPEGKKLEQAKVLLLKLLYEANSSTDIWNVQVLNARKHIVIPQ